MLRKSTLAATALLLLLTAVNSASADPLTLTLAEPTQAGTPGSLFVFSGSITNISSSAVTVRTLSLRLPVELGIEIPSPFEPFLFYPPLLLQPTESTGVIPLFQVRIDPAFSVTVPRTVFGFYDLLDANRQILARAQYNVVILPNQAAIPEPATALLLGTGLAGVGAAVRGKRKANKSEAG